MPGLTGGPPDRYLIFSVDTEPDDPLWLGLHVGHWTHENLRGMERLGNLLRACGVKATHLLSHSVAVHGGIVDAIGRDLAEGRCEVGTHFHPGDTPPFGPWDLASKDNILRLSRDALEEKFARLHSAVTERFGPVRTYRSGAWTLDARIIGLLARNGYRIDSSVTPGVSWRLNGRPSYFGAPVEAYYLDRDDPCRPGDSGILEIPVSILAPPLRNGNEKGGLIEELFSMPLAARKGWLPGLVRAVRPPSPRWLRPAFGTLPEMQEMVRLLEGRDYLHIMCHSNELWPGASPYISTERELDAFYERLEGIFRFALDLGYIPVTLGGYADRFAASAPRNGLPADASPAAWASLSPPAATAPIGPAGPGGGQRHSPARKKWGMAAKLAVSAGTLAIVIAETEWVDMRRFLGQTNLALAAVCMAALLADLVLNAYKTSYLAGRPGVPLWDFFRINLIKMFFNNILPGGAGGEAARMVYLGRITGSWGQSAAVIVLDRLSGLWLQVLFSSLSLLLLTGGTFAFFPRTGVAVGGLVISCLAPPLVLALLPFCIGQLPKLPLRIAQAREWGSFQTFWRKFARDRKRLIGLAVISLLSQFTLMQILYLATKAMGGDIPFWHTSPILLLAVMSSMIPLSLGGLGVMEGAFALAFALMGSQSELGFLVSLLMRALGLLPALAGWAVFLKDGGPSADPLKVRA